MDELGETNVGRYRGFIEYARKWEEENAAEQEAEMPLLDEMEGGLEYSHDEDAALYEALCKIVPKTPITYKYHTPSNSDSEKDLFLTAKKEGRAHEPSFTYKATNTPSPNEVSDKLARLKAFRETVGGSTPLRRLYARLSIETSRLLILATLSQKKGFSEASKRVYKSISESEKDSFEAQVKSFYHQQREKEGEERTINQEEFKKLLEALVEGVGLDTKVRFKSREDMTAKTSASSKWISIREDFEVSLTQSLRMAIHEVGHALTQSRGKEHPSGTGSRKTAKSLQIEEGVNMAFERLLIEKLVENGVKDLTSGLNERDILPQLRAIAVMHAEKHSFDEVFTYLKDLGADDDTAWIVTTRVKRGVKDVSGPGANYKDVSYIRGYETVQKIIADSGAETIDEKLDVLDMLAQGRFSADEAMYLKQMGLQNQEFPVPDFFKTVVGIIADHLRVGAKKNVKST